MKLDAVKKETIMLTPGEIWPNTASSTEIPMPDFTPDLLASAFGLALNFFRQVERSGRRTQTPCGICSKKPSAWPFQRKSTHC